METILAIAFAILTLGVLAVALFAYQLLLQQGRILSRLTVLEKAYEAMDQELDLITGEATAGGSDRPEGLAIGAPAPAFDLPNLAGNRVALEQFRGRQVLLMFFSNTCSWCHKMAPDLARLPLDGSDGHPKR